MQRKAAGTETKKPDSLWKSGFSWAAASEPRSDGNGWMTQAVAASLSFFIGRTLTFTVAGLAAKVVS